MSKHDYHDPHHGLRETYHDLEVEDKERGRLAGLLEMLANGNLSQHDLAELAVLRHRYERRSR